MKNKKVLVTWLMLPWMALCGCAPSIDDPIVGKWDEPDAEPGTVWEFKPNGKYKWENDNRVEDQGMYAVSDKGLLLRSKTQGQDMPIKLSWRSPNELELQWPGGHPPDILQRQE